MILYRIESTQYAFRVATLDLLKKLKAISLFSDLPDETLGPLATGCSFVTFESGEVLFRGGDTANDCFIVSYGAVRLARQLPGGKEVVMSFCRPGDFIGAIIMANPNPRYPVTATATESSGLIKIPRQQYLGLWQSQPAVARTVNVHMMNRLMEFQDDKAMAVSSVSQRIARFILRTLESQPEHFGNRLNLKLSRRDIAERVGTTVETVIRILSQWTQNGWIATEDQLIDVLDRNALQGLLDKD